MPNEIVCEAGYKVVQQKAKSFYERYERKAELQHATHFCPGCGHGVIHKMLAKAMDELGVQDQSIMISPVGCGVFVYKYFDAGHIAGAHGRAPAVATGAKRTRPQATVIAYQGDGDLSAIGCAEIVHAANRGENITVIFVNNAIYSMTGGQIAPTTLIGQKSTTSPEGRNALVQGYPLHVSEMLAALQGPTYIERVGLGDNKEILAAGRAIKKAVENQVRGLGFSLIEVLSPCPTIWKKSPVEAQRWVREEMEKTYPLGVKCDRTQERAGQTAPPVATPTLDELPAILGVDEASLPTGNPLPEAKRQVDLRMRAAGFGGQGVLLLGELLADAGLDAGLEVSWMPSYGPEIRSGTSNCHVRLSGQAIDSPMVPDPNVLVAMNEPSLKKFVEGVRPGGWALYNGDTYPLEFVRDGVKAVAVPFTRMADELGDTRVANMVALGSVLELTGAVPQVSVDASLRRHIKNKRFLELDERAIALGRQKAREAVGQG